MSVASRSAREHFARAVPRAWQAFLGSAENPGARASIHADGSEAPLDVAARLEFLDDSHLTIHVALERREALEARSARGVVELLSARERAVVTLIATGHETQEIADTLYVSPSTVRTHVRNAMSKVGAHTRAQLVAAVIAGQEYAGVAHADGAAEDRSSS